MCASGQRYCIAIDRVPDRRFIRRGAFHMTNDDNRDAGMTLLAFILGAAGGALVALMYAPASGRETRAYLARCAQQARDQAADAANRVGDFVQQGRQSAVTAIDSWRQTASTAVDRGREAIEQGRDAVSYAVEQGREAYRQAKAQDLG